MYVIYYNNALIYAFIYTNTNTSVFANVTFKTKTLKNDSR